MIPLSTRTKEAIKTGLAMTIAYGIALHMDWEKPYWAGFAVAMISLATAGQSLNKSALRMLGTLVTTVVALIFIALFAQDRWLFMLFLSAYVGFCTYMMAGKKHQYFWHVCGFVCVVICMDAGPNPKRPDWASWSTAWFRSLSGPSAAAPTSRPPHANCRRPRNSFTGPTWI
jgi:uncharacterized membrane protein YccC